MNNFLTRAFGAFQLNAKERKIRIVTIVLGVFIILVTLRWQFLAQPLFVEFAFSDRITETGVISDHVPAASCLFLRFRIGLRAGINGSVFHVEMVCFNGKGSLYCGKTASGAAIGGLLAGAGYGV